MTGGTTVRRTCLPAAIAVALLIPAAAQARSHHGERPLARNYLFAEVDKDTSYPSPPASGTWVGTALAVKLRGSDRWYDSHHGVPDWSIQRDDPAATTIELPPGMTQAQIAAIKAIAVPVAATGDTPAPAPADYTIHVRSLNRGFLLDPSYLPQPSFLSRAGDAVLTPQQPEAVIWASG
jgi:hypothetical protein